MTMAKDFRAAHAGGATWQDAARDIIIGLGKLDASHRLGFLYVTDAFAESFDEIAIFLRQTTGVPHWIGTIGFGVVGAGKEYFDEPALSVMVTPLSEDAFRVFDLNDEGADALRRDHGPWLDQADSPLVIVHADPRNDSLLDDIDDLASTTNGFLVGGLTASRGHYGLLADRTDQGPVSGAMVSLHSVPVQLGLTQGCSPIGRPQAPRISVSVRAIARGSATPLVSIRMRCGAGCIAMTRVSASSMPRAWGSSRSSPLRS